MGYRSTEISPLLLAFHLVIFQQPSHQLFGRSQVHIRKVAILRGAGSSILNPFLCAKVSLGTSKKLVCKGFVKNGTNYPLPKSLPCMLLLNQMKSHALRMLTMYVDVSSSVKWAAPGFRSKNIPAYHSG